MPSHYFSDNVENEIVLRDLCVTVAGQSMELKTAEGVFSSKAIDKGTQVLLNFLHSERGLHFYEDLSKTSRILDLGCGWGVISVDALLSSKAEVVGVDVNAHAAQLTNLNTNSERAKAYLTDELPTQSYDLILSNPPIRIGKNATLELLKLYLARLSPNGKALFVIQKNLGSDSIAASLSSVYSVKKLASSKGFRILEVQKK